MALISCSYYSPALSGKNDFYLVIPNDLPPMMTAMTAKTPAFQRPMKTIVLLHGFSGCSRDWLNGSSIQDLCSQYNVAAVMPSCRNSFYLDRVRRLRERHEVPRLRGLHQFLLLRQHRGVHRL